MDRWTGMAIRMYAPAFGLLAASMLATFAIEGIRQSALLAGVYQAAQWLPLIGFGVGALWMLITSFRLWRWNRGESTDVCECGGLLGRERDGRYGAYRKCLACTRNINERHWRK